MTHTSIVTKLLTTTIPRYMTIATTMSSTFTNTVTLQKIVATTLVETRTLRELAIIDQSLRLVKLPSKGAKRLIVLQSYWAELVSVLGHGDDIVGIGSYVKYSHYIPDYVRKLPVVGSVFKGLNYEEVLALKPDLEIMDVGYGRADEIIEKLSSLGIQVLTLKLRDFKDLLQAIILIGQALGELEKSRELVKYLQDHYDKLVTWCRGIKYRPKTLMVSASKIIKSEGAITTLYVWSPWGLAIEVSGGHNIACDYYDKSWMKVDLETIVKLDPEAIILVGYKSSDLEKAKEIVLEKWRVVKAVKEGKVYTIQAGSYEGAYLDWSPRLIIAYYQLASILHGDEFPYDWRSLANELLEKYYPWLKG